MKIAICTIGSRGDIQPFLVLGEYLKRNGHTVKVSSAEMYASLAADYNLNYIPFSGNYELLVDSEAMKKVVGGNPFTIKKNLKEKIYPVIESSLDTFFELAHWADVIVYHPKSLIDSFGYLFPEKLIKAYVVPVFTATRAFPSPIISFLSVPKFLNRFTYKITNSLLSTVKSPVHNFYKKHNLRGKFNYINTPVIYGISPSFLPQPDDYPADHYFTGFWFKRESEMTVPHSVETFFNTKKRKLIITFGSMPYKSPVDINDFISAVQEKTDVKVLVVKAWGLKEKDIKESEDVLAIDKAPFDKLFPMADAVVHHGGAGTTGVALKSGIPMMICPVLYPVGDQLFWGEQVEKAGVGVKPVPLSRLKVKTFVESVNELLDEKFKVNSQNLKAEIEKEDGLKNALHIIEDIGRQVTN